MRNLNLLGKQKLPLQNRSLQVAMLIISLQCKTRRICVYAVFVWVILGIIRDIFSDAFAPQLVIPILEIFVRLLYYGCGMLSYAAGNEIVPGIIVIYTKHRYCLRITKNQKRFLNNSVL